MTKRTDTSKSSSSELNKKPVQFWVPRIRLMFCAEDPVNFAHRVVDAFELRRKTEILLRYHLYIDCMPTEGVSSITPEALKRITRWSKTAKIATNDARYFLLPIFCLSFIPRTFILWNVSHNFGKGFKAYSKAIIKGRKRMAK